MGKIRIYELAKELHQDSKTIINQLNKMNVEVSNHMSTIDQNDAEKIRTHFTAKHLENRANAKNEKNSQHNHKSDKGNEQKQMVQKKPTRENTKHNDDKRNGTKNEMSKPAPGS